MSKSVNIVYFGNNYVGREVLSWLIQRGNVPRLVVMHRREQSYYFDDIQGLALTNQIEIIYFDQVYTPKGIDQIRTINPDIGISAYYGYILEKEVLDLFPMGVVNLHGAFLPWCRGRNPNVWTVIDKAPAGVTLHLMDSGTDTGAILAQREVDLTPDMTAKDLYRKMERAILGLFFEKFLDIVEGKITPQLQSKEKGTFHLASELNELKKLDLDEVMPVSRAIDILRACTFPPYPGASFVIDGVEYDINIKISPVESQTE